MTRLALIGADVHDGVTLHEKAVLLVEHGRVLGITTVPPEGVARRDLGGGTLVPGFVDLQVNGGGGDMLGAGTSPEALCRMVEVHRALGCAAILPTLITDRPDVTRQVIDLVAGAVRDGIAGIAGLHLEGPHLSHARKGAHDPALIRRMEADDLDLLLSAADRLLLLKVTVAPESVTVPQAAAMVEAGILVSLGHTDAPYETCTAYADAGVRCVTHLFNAMSGLGHRAPGLVGAVLDDGRLSAGVIADGLHVHPAAMGAALRAKRGPGAVFLISDSMAVAGSDLTEFFLGGRRILRDGGRLTLEDGTLAGADLTMGRAISTVAPLVGPGHAVAMATRIPADMIGRSDLGRLEAGTIDIIHLQQDGRVRRVDVSQ